MIIFPECISRRTIEPTFHLGREKFAFGRAFAEKTSTVEYVLISYEIAWRSPSKKPEADRR